MQSDEEPSQRPSYHHSRRARTHAATPLHRTRAYPARSTPPATDILASGKRPDDDLENDEYYAKLITPKSWNFFAFKCMCVDAQGTGGELSAKRKPPGAPCKHAAAGLYTFLERLADHSRPMEHLLEPRGVDAQLPSSETP